MHTDSRNESTTIPRCLLDTHRFTQWIGYNFTLFEPDWSTVRGEELYDHTVDPDENNNVYLDPDYQEIRQQLYELVYEGWWGVVETQG